MTVSLRKIFISIISIVIILLFMLPVNVMASSYVPYTTYTYSFDGEPQESPNAYVPQARYDGISLESGQLSDPSDMFADSENGIIYIADTGNNRIVILNKAFKTEKTLSGFTDESGKISAFSGPRGIFRTKNGHLFVADTGNGRIVELDKNYNLIRIITKPNSPFWPDDKSFKPISVVVDSGNRIYALSENLNLGVVNMTADGEFLGFYGAQKVRQSIVDWFRKKFATKEQKARMVKTVPRVYNSIFIDNRDFVWLTANSIEKQNLIEYMSSKSSVDAPIKRLNPNGDDILFRNAKWAPGGDLGEEPSGIVDVCVKENGIYSILDGKKNKIFTYDSDGNLLYAFGGTGQQIGTFNLCSSVVYFNNELIVLDKGYGTLTRFSQTEYGNLIESAIVADKNRDFDNSVKCWNQVLKQNQNFDMAYTGIAEAFMRSGEYKSAMNYFKIARDTENYSKAFRQYRSAFVRENLLWIILVIVAIGFGIYFVNSKIKKFNKKSYPVGSVHTFKDEFLYSFYSIYHPIKGANGIKLEGRGSVRGALAINVLVILTFIYKGIGTGYIFNNILAENFNLLQTILSVVLMILLWCIASWALTTLSSGEGSIKQIYITTSYSLMPLVLINIPVTIASNFMLLDEQSFITFFVFLSFAWAFLLIFSASMTIHDYTFSKNLFTVILSLAGMLIILFLAVLLILLTSKIGSFLSQIYQEVINRF